MSPIQPRVLITLRALPSRRLFLALGSATLARSSTITRPAVSEEACPIETIPHGLLRKPPGKGPFPAVLWIHGGLQKQSIDQLRNLALNAANPSRFLAAGYVVAPITYRSRDHDPQSRVSVEDCIAASEHLRKLPFVDSSSVVGYGCSGGGDLLLEMAAAGAKLCAIVPEEPATVLFTGVFNSGLPKNGALFTPADAAPISEDPKRYYTGKYKAITRAKIARIQCPILIVQGDVQPINRFNAEVLLPELRQAGKKFETKTYPGCPHCFAFAGNRKPVEALQAFKDAEEFCRRHVTTKPKSLDASLIREVPVV